MFCGFEAHLADHFHMTEPSVNFIQVVGPSRFFCLVDGCTEHVDDDAEAYCEDHWVDVNISDITHKHRNGFTLAFWLDLKAKQREVEKTGTGQHVVSSTVPYAQAGYAGCTDGFGNPWPPQKNTLVLGSNVSGLPWNVQVRSGTDEVIIHWANADGFDECLQTISRPK